MKIFARRRVLVVDDNAHARAFLAQILGAVDVEVTQAETGRQALSILGASAAVDAVILDMFMTPMDGIALARAIRASDKAQVAALPIIMASAQASAEVVRAAAAAGVSGFIAKPFTPAAVLKALAKALTPRPAATARATAVNAALPPAAPVDNDDPQAMAYL
jgi:CheY-like chemotaxis protein